MFLCAMNRGVPQSFEYAAVQRACRAVFESSNTMSQAATPRGRMAAPRPRPGDEDE